MSNHGRDSQGRYIYSGNWERFCECGHTLGVHTADAPQACGTYGTGLLDCLCKQFKPAKPNHISETEEV